MWHMPSEHQVLMPVLDSAAKTDHIDPDVCDLCVSSCTNISSQITTLEESYSHEFLANSLFIVVTVADSFRLISSLVDVVNVFHSTIRHKEQMACTNLPHL